MHHLIEVVQHFGAGGQLGHPAIQSTSPRRLRARCTRHMAYGFSFAARRTIQMFDSTCCAP